MKLKIGNKKFFNEKEYRKIKNIDESFYYLTGDNNGTIIDLDNDSYVYLEGDFYYYTDNSKNAKFISINEKNLIRNILISNGLDHFLAKVEGDFIGALFDHKNMSITLFCDQLKKKNLYYSTINNNFIFSTNVNDIISTIKNINYNQFGLYSYLVLGYTPAKHSIYENVFEIGPMQTIKYRNNNIEITSNIKPTQIENYKQENIIGYRDILTESIISRSSKDENWVQLTGGLDTSIILDILLQEYDSKNVKAIISSIVDPNGKCINAQDVNRAQLVADYYGVNLEIVETAPSSKIMLDYFLNDIEIFKKQSFVHPGFCFFPIANLIKGKIPESGVIYSGEAADSLQNYGYTKTCKYKSNLLNHFEDKVKNYHYTPSFYKKIKNNNANSDVCHKLYKKFLGEKNFDSTTSNDLFEYLYAFVFSDYRLPSSKISILNKIATDSGIESFKKWLIENYFGEVTKNITENTFYFWLSYLYLNFHLQGRNNNIIRQSIGQNNIKYAIPYFDKRMLNFLSKMPTNWGRSLVLKELKYASRTISKKYLNVPLKIVNALDNKTFYNNEPLICKYFGKNKYFIDYIKSTLNINSINEKLDIELFNKNYIKDNLQKIYSDSSIDNDFYLIYKLLCLN